MSLKSNELSLKNVEKIFEIFYSLNPIPQGELYYTNPFTLLVAVILSAQSTDKGVNKATKNLFEIAATPQAMRHLGTEAIASFIQTIGLYKRKACYVYETSCALIEKHKGEVPQKRRLLEDLPGVGPKTANVVLSIAFGFNTIAVDTHVYRVSRRMGLTQATTVSAVERDLLERIPRQYLYHAHHWLILHGRYICRSKNPACCQCPLASVCLKIGLSH